MALTTDGSGALTLTPIGSITEGLAGAEISAFDAASKRLFTTSDAGLQVIDLSDPANPVLVDTLVLSGPPYFAVSTDISSVATFNGLVAVSILNPIKVEAGQVVIIDAATGALVGEPIEVGNHPDMVTFTPDGSKILVANEGELQNIADVVFNPRGSVSIIDVATQEVQTASFTSFDGSEDALRAEGIRIAEGVVASLDFEPEYIAISPDGTKAMVTLQENNAIAILNIATATFTDIVSAGKQDFSTLLADFSDRDGASNSQLVKLETGNPVFGLRMPDAIASYIAADGQTYYIIANEGDDRDDFLNDPETVRVGSGSYDLDNTTFPNETALKANGELGRLTAFLNEGDTNNDGDIDEITILGGRSFSILDSNGALVFDSGDILERIQAVTPGDFTADTALDDTRSDNKGPEPESVIVKTIGSKSYAFVALERGAGGVTVFDVTDPADVSFVGYTTQPGHISPEGLTFIPAEDSPNGENLLVVSNEVSNSIQVLEVAPPTFTLQLLHFADAEAGLLAGDTAPNLAALVDAFDDDYANTLILAGGDNYIPGPFFAAGTDPTVAATHSRGDNPGAADIEIHNRIGVEASTIGNHEFDFGTRVFSDIINDAAFPYLSANLDFSGDSDIRARYQETVETGGLEEAKDLARKIVPSAVVTKGEEKIGLVGATTQIVETIASTNGVEVKGFDGDGNETNDMALLARQLQIVIDDLREQGVNKIILMAHLQQIAFEQELAPLLEGVDIILAAGSNTRLGDSDDVAVAFPGHAADFANTYPIVTAGKDGDPTVIVNTDNEFTYLGRLVVEFNSEGVIDVAKLGELTSINGAYAATEANVAAAWEDDGGLEAAFAEGTKGEQVADITEAVDAVIAAKDGNVLGFTTVYLEGERNIVRNQETNLGNLSADANLDALKVALGDEAGSTFVASLKNGGGIRTAIGSVDVVTGDKEPPLANADAGKPEGGVSQLDIENSLRFNNSLMAFDTTAAGLKAILEHGVSVLGNQGRFPQIGGVSFSYDPDLPAGSRITSIALIDENDKLVAKLVENGEVSDDAPEKITLVTLNFLANGGDGYPMRANGENFRYLLNDGTLSAPVDEALDFTAAANVPANILGEQQTFSEYMQERYGTPESAYDIADTAQSGDTRIQNLNFRDDTVLERGLSVEGDGEANTLEGSEFDDELSGLGGDDVLKTSGGDDVLDGGEGNDTADYSSLGSGIVANLETGIVTSTDSGFTTGSAPMLAGENGYEAHALVTIGDTIPDTTGALNPTTAGDYQPVGILDGIGAYELDANTVRVLVNHELRSGSGTSYTLENGTELDGARISYFDIDKTSKLVKDAGIAYNTVYDRAGNVVTDGAQLDGRAALDRFCSGGLYEANEFGTGKGLVSRMYITGEETSSGPGGSNWALDVETGNLWALPDLGRGGWENVAQVDTGTTTHVAFLMADDTSGAPMYLYVGEKNPAGNFLEKNGLVGGKVYIWKADEAGVNSPAEFVSGSKTGTWVEIQVRDASKAGTEGYDELGYKNDDVLQAEADTLGGFTFSRPEDVSVNPANGTQVVLASTGANLSGSRTADGIADGTDIWGTVYTFDLDFTSLTAPKATVNVLYNGNTDDTLALRSPDNLDWADDGFIYVNEDRSANWASAQAQNPNEASIVKIDPATGELTRVAAIDRSAVPSGQTDSNPTDFGNWESSGILDVSELFGEEPGTLFITDVQAHSINLGADELVEGGQLALISKGVSVGTSGTDTLVSIENLVGTSDNDQIRGTSGANRLEGGEGNDQIRGAQGNDTLLGGEGNDGLLGGAGNDTLLGGEGDDKLYGSTGDDRIDGGAGKDLIDGNRGKDVLTGGADEDVFDFNSRFDSTTSARDTITDFDRGEDIINLRTIDANTKKAGNQTFTFIGDEAFSKTAGELNYKKTAAGVRVEGDVNGDGKADFAIDVNGVTSLNADDFLL